MIQLKPIDFLSLSFKSLLSVTHLSNCCFKIRFSCSNLIYNWIIIRWELVYETESFNRSSHDKLTSIFKLPHYSLIGLLTLDKYAGCSSSNCSATSRSSSSDIFKLWNSTSDRLNYLLMFYQGRIVTATVLIALSRIVDKTSSRYNCKDRPAINNFLYLLTT